MIKDILWKWNIPKATKVLLCKIYYLPIVTYGAGTWVWSNKDQSSEPFWGSFLIFLVRNIGKRTVLSTEALLWTWFAV
jgi:hypothetical protein